jgi:hypothetical protein
MALGIIFGDRNSLCFHVRKEFVEDIFQKDKKSND